MPKLRRLNGREVVAVLEDLGFELVRIRGSHHQMKRTVEGAGQTISVPVHGKKSLKIGTLKSIYR
jgi:predicted RNA binding protein YcfA (HicA-like mRNA interferase family)